MAATRYAYHDAGGNVLYYKVREEGKQFRLTDKDGNPGAPPGVPSLPYNLPLLLDAIKRNETVYLVEGEKDADRLLELGETATTARDGAGNFPPGFFEYFKGGRVVIVADKDAPGFKSAHKAYDELEGIAATRSVFTVNNAVTAKGADVSDHLDAGFSLNELRAVGTGGPKVIHMHEVVPVDVAWLWKGYIPLGAITTLDGDPDMGKSTIMCDIAARVSTGRRMPDGSKGILGGVLMLSAEDTPEAAIIKRLTAAGADLTRIKCLQEISAWQEHTGYEPSDQVIIPRDIPYIESLSIMYDVRLIVLDPLMAFFDSSTDTYRDQDVRRVLYQLKLVAEKAGASVTIPRHLTKQQGGKAIYRGGGSIGIIGAARSGLMVGMSPSDDGLRILACPKHNLSAEPPSLTYELVAVSDTDAPYVRWGSISDIKGDELATGESDTLDSPAAAWYYGYLKDSGGEASWGDIKREGFSEGYSEYALKRAQKRLKTAGRVAWKEGSTTYAGRIKRSTVWYICELVPAPTPPANPQVRDSESGESGESGYRDSAALTPLSLSCPDHSERSDKNWCRARIAPSEVNQCPDT